MCIFFLISPDIYIYIYICLTPPHIHTHITVVVVLLLCLCITMRYSKVSRCMYVAILSSIHKRGCMESQQIIWFACYHKDSESHEMKRTTLGDVKDCADNLVERKITQDASGNRSVRRTFFFFRA